MNSSDQLPLDAREIAWAIHFLSKVAPVQKDEQYLLLTIIHKLDIEYARRKQHG